MRNAKKMFLRGLLQSFFIVSILLIVGVLSYQATMHFGKVTEDEVVVAYKEQPVPEPITEASVDDISKNLIYCYNEDTGEISKIILEIFHCENKRLTYITIPVRTQFTMSDSLYRELILVHPSIPQVIKLSGITKYLDTATVFDYGVLMIEDLLSIDISYYTAIPQEVYDTMFTGNDRTPEDGVTKEAEAKVTERTVSVEVFSDDYIKLLQTFQTTEEVSAYIEEIYPLVTSNLTLFEKMNYLDSYCNTPQTNISFELIKGEDRNSAFVINPELALLQLNELTAKDIKN